MRLGVSRLLGGDQDSHLPRADDHHSTSIVRDSGQSHSHTAQLDTTDGCVLDGLVARPAVSRYFFLDGVFGLAAGLTREGSISWMRCDSVFLAVTGFAFVTRISVAVVPPAVALIPGCAVPGFPPIV